MRSNHETSTWHSRATGLRWVALVCLSFMSVQAQALQTVTLAWDANSETNLAGYKLYYGTASRVYTSVLNVGNVTSASVSNLVANTNYHFAVTAYNDLGVESDFSSEAVLDNMKPLVTITSPSANLR